MWGLGFLTKNIGSLREAVDPFYIACAQIRGRNHDWVVPLIKARKNGSLGYHIPVALSRIY
jgi:hypothetical protein